MISEANETAISAAGLSFSLGATMPYLPDMIREWRDNHPDQEVSDGLVLTQPWSATDTERSAASPTESPPTSAAPGAGSTSRSARPRRRSRALSRSNATGSSGSPARPRASTATSKAKARAQAG